jgi:hypothetical protein
MQLTGPLRPYDATEGLIVMPRRVGRWLQVTRKRPYKLSFLVTRKITLTAKCATHGPKL